MVINIKIENLDIGIIEDALDRVGKRELPEEELLEFAKECLLYEKKMLNKRTKMFSDDEIEEKEINQFDFHNDDGYRYGVWVKFNNDSLLTLEREKDDDGNIIEIKAKPVDVDGKRIRLVIGTRKGLMTVFLGMDWFDIINDLLDKSEDFVLVGGLTIKWKNRRTQEWTETKEEKEEYYEREGYTYNLWQFVQIIKTGKGVKLIPIIKAEE